MNLQGGTRNIIPFHHPTKFVTSHYRCYKRASECCSSCKMRYMSPVCKMANNGRLTVDQKVKVVLFYAETKSLVATQRRFRAHFGTRWAPCKQTIYRLSLGTIFQPMRINYVPDVKRFCKNKNVLRCTINGMTFRAPPCMNKNFDPLRQLITVCVFILVLHIKLIA